MAFGFGIGDIITILQLAIAAKEKIEDAPDQIDDVARRMGHHRQYLLSVDQFLNQQGVAQLRPTQKAELIQFMAEFKADAQRIREIIEKWKNNTGPGGLQLRFGFVAQTLFALGSSPKELQKLSDNLDQYRVDISQQLSLMSNFGQNAILAKKRLVSLTPKQPTKDLSILFVDSVNESRSVVAQAYAQLMRSWTVRSSGAWRIAHIHSAGIFVRSADIDVADLQLSAYQSPNVPGSKPPNLMALAALFDNNLFNQPYKAMIKRNTEHQRSRGLSKQTFSNYDYVFLFNAEHGAKLWKLRTAMQKKFGGSIVGQGKTLLLGQYGTSKYDEIWEPKKYDGGIQKREDWNKTIANIKVSFKAFLEKELGWVKPKD